MAAISSNIKSHSHARSNSLPSTSDQISIFNEFYRFQASLESTTSCSSSSSFVGNKLNCLNDMYESIQPFLSLPSTQQSLAKGCYKEQLNIFLDELVGLLDLCSTTKDALSISIDSAKQLQSVIRRKRGNNHGLTSAVQGYLSQRKKMKKDICKTLSGLQKENASSVKEDNIAQSNINILKEMRLNSLAVFESLLTFILGSNRHSKPKAWSFVSTMIGGTQTYQTPEELEVQIVDQQLHALITNKKTKADSLDVDHVQKGLAEMESSLIGLSEGVECLYRHLIKTRVSILNILNC